MGKIGNHSAQDTFFQRRWGEGGPGAPREEKGSRQLGRCRALPADIGLGPGHPAPPARRGRALDSGGDEPASVRASQLLHILEGEGDGPRGGSSGVTPCTSFCRHTGTQLCPRTRIRTAGPRAGHGHRGAVVALRGGQRWRSPAGPLSSSCDMLQPHHVCTRKPSPSRPPTSHRPSRGPRGAGSGAALIGQAPSLNILNLTPCHQTHPSARGQEAPPRSPFSPEPAAAAGLGGPG